MSCGKMCHDPGCYDDTEHYCHDNDCNPERKILWNIKNFFIDVVRGERGLTHEECKGVLTEISKYVKD
jgi:hypothetical protein